MSIAAYRIYPAVFEPNFHELEYFVPLERGPEAIAAMRELMLASQPDAVFPMEVRTVAADDAYLPPVPDGDDGDLGVGQAGHRLLGLPARGRRLLGEFGARVHWGKLHFLTPRAARWAVPARRTTFIGIRRELDPAGVFLNEHLRPLFA